MNVDQIARSGSVLLTNLWGVYWTRYRQGNFKRNDRELPHFERGTACNRFFPADRTHDTIGSIIERFSIKKIHLASLKSNTLYIFLHSSSRSCSSMADSSCCLRIPNALNGFRSNYLFNSSISI